MKEEHGYDPLLDIYPFTTLIQLKDFLGRIHHCAAVVGKWTFDSNLPLPLPTTQENLGYCCINYNEAKLMNIYKWIL